MALITITLKVEESEWIQLPMGERSKLVRDFVSNYIAYKSGDMNKIDEQILLRKKVTLDHKKMSVDTELESINQTLSKLKEDREKAEEEKLLEEKERIESAKKCLNCGKILEEAHKKFEFNKGLVCNTCFFGADKDSINRWNGGPTS